MVSNLIDIKGKKINRLTVLEYTGKSKWLCLCDCGNEVTHYSHNIREGKAKECNKCAKITARNCNFKDLKGQTFGFWKVISYLGHGKWECECQCGRCQQVSGKFIRLGRSKSCRFCKGVKSKIFSSGMVIGSLTLLKRIIKGRDIPYWECMCKCGGKDLVSEYNLKYEKRVTCRRCSPNIKRVGNSAFNGLFSSYKRSAQNRGISWGLSIEDFGIITKSDCHYTGLPPSSIIKTTTSIYTYNGIDRIDSSKGYVIDNCVPCNGVVNKMKMALPYEEFLNMCSIISNHMANKDIKNNMLKAI